MDATQIKFDDDQTYHNDKRISASMLKLAHTKTMAHVYAQFFDPDREPVSSSSLEFGTMFHCAVLQPERFDDWFVVMPDGLDRRTKEGKQLWADIQASGKDPVRIGDWERQVKMAAKIRELPDFVDILANNPIFEGCVYTKSARAKFDIFVPPCTRWPRGLIADIKTAKDSSPLWFGRDACRLGYHIQAAHYIDTVREGLGLLDDPEFMIFASEKTEPFLAAPYLLGDELVHLGRKDAAVAIDKIILALETNVWPGYHTQAEALEFPDWAFEDDEEEIELGDE